MPEQYDHEHAPKCPHCGDEMGDAWELNLNDGESNEVECGECDETFVVTATVEITYSTKPVECSDGHQWGDSRRVDIDQAFLDRHQSADDTSSFWCRICEVCTKTDYSKRAPLGSDGPPEWKDDDVEATS